MTVGQNENDGKIEITTVYKCSSNYSSCSKGKCVSSCPIDSIQIGDRCEPCKYPCGSCSILKDNCTACAKGYYFYDSKCYSECSQLNDENNFYGKNDNTSKCEECEYKCVECSTNS